MTLDDAPPSSVQLLPCSIKDVDYFLQKHYLHKRLGVCVLTLEVVVDGIIVGCIVFALPPTQTAKRYGCVTWELARLYVVDEMPKNSESYILSRAIKYVRQNHKDVKMLVSYADPSANHKGTIYKASNWICDGRTDQERKSPRCDYQDEHGRRYSRRSHVPPTAQVTRIPRVSKHRFIYPL